MNDENTYEQGLTELLEVVSGKKWPLIGPGLSTYPTGDERNRRLHEGMLELERRGKVERVNDSGRFVVWKPK